MLPVITIDGPGGVGKGTLSMRLAQQLGWHFLDSGALYRVLGYAALKHQVNVDDEKNLSQLAQNLQVAFKQESALIILEGEDVTKHIRTEMAGSLASKISAFAGVRQALLKRQRDFLTLPGLVADGRDMGTVVFPHAFLKIFLDATPEIRAHRRYEQLKTLGNNVTMAALLKEIAQRDARDRQRPISPLVPAVDAHLIDTTELSINDVYTNVLNLVRQREFEMT